MKTLSILRIQTAIGKASKQLAKGIEAACTPALLEKSQNLLEKKYGPLKKEDHETLKTEVIKEQVRIVKGYIKKGNAFENNEDWGYGGTPLKLACTCGNGPVLRTLLKSGLNPQRPSENKNYDQLLSVCTEKTAKILLSFYPPEALKEIAGKIPPLQTLTDHAGWVKKYRPWITELAKRELIKRIVEKKTQEREINI
jgi:hypothetical protein